MEFIKKYIGLIVGVVVGAIYLIAFKFPINDKMPEGFDLVNIHLGLSKYLVYTLAVLCIGFYIYKVIQNPKKGLRLGLGLAALVILFLINYSGASSDIAEVSNLENISILPGRYKFVGGMISTTIGLIVIGGLVLAGFTVKKIIEDAKA